LFFSPCPLFCLGFGVYGINLGECLRAEEEFALCIAASVCYAGVVGQSLVLGGLSQKVPLVGCVAAHRVPAGSVTLISPQIQLAKPSAASAAPKLMVNAEAGHH